MWKWLVNILIGIILVAVPASGKMYVDLKHQEALTIIARMEGKLDAILEYNGITYIPKERTNAKSNQ